MKYVLQTDKTYNRILRTRRRLNALSLKNNVVHRNRSDDRKYYIRGLASNEILSGLFALHGQRIKKILRN